MPEYTTFSTIWIPGMKENLLLLAAKPYCGRTCPRGRCCAPYPGADSMCLLHLQHGGGNRASVSAAAHFNHQLSWRRRRTRRGFVRSWCPEERNIPAPPGGEMWKSDGGGRHVEEAARKLRYALLRRDGERRRAMTLATAHHADDNAETMLLNLIRGTGPPALPGIPQVRGEYLPAVSADLPGGRWRTMPNSMRSPMWRTRPIKRRLCRPEHPCGTMSFQSCGHINSRSGGEHGFTAGVVARGERPLWRSRPPPWQSRRSAPAAGFRLFGAAEMCRCAVAERAALRSCVPLPGESRTWAPPMWRRSWIWRTGAGEDARVSLPYGLIAAVHSGVLTICRASRAACRRSAGAGPSPCAGAGIP